jgi:hypothetical protein
LRPALADSWGKREEIIPLPGGAITVQMVGPFGTGKATFLRQCIGTIPKERFPSTSKGKTTTCDMELICAHGDYKAVVAFLSRDRTRAYIEECVEAVVSAAAKGFDDARILRAFLEHSEQRLRPSYTLGKYELPGLGTEEDDVDDDDQDASEDATTGLVTDQERQDNYRKLHDWISRCKGLANAILLIDTAERAMDVGALPTDQRVSRLFDDLRQICRQAIIAEGVRYQTVRGVFVEAEPAFFGSKIMRKSHIQLAVRDPSRILEYFRPDPADYLTAS